MSDRFPDHSPAASRHTEGGRPDTAQEPETEHEPAPEVSASRAATKDNLPIALSLVPFAVVIGVTIGRSTTVDDVVGLLSALGYYSGTAHLASISVLTDGSGVALVVGTTVIINARMMMYSAALEPNFRDQPRWFRWLGPHFVIDQTYAVASVRPDLRGAPTRFRHYWLTAAGLIAVVWIGSMTMGVVAGPVLPEIAALDFAVPAVFLALLVPQLRESDARLPAALGATGAVIASPLPHGLGLLVGAAVGLLPALARKST